ncbi:hypothetical protein Bb109J_c1956 [Bdellovibrio bacteriovorus]|uniref:hypothetical protein n=1 Tax=Bdellovibrio bacteriovorus TaxID=959 RepID=UPI00045C10A8|nr:hypothetical protein [Bdellovibrio bacteriovorus]AHZ84646.1 hypothetical protein EP01_06805 [Bdellovibrio bacteriovorus]BEV68536.1 hypothetical protein Bb109J_c1956 [Bdellovibrio bacteriovorus]
MKDSRHLFGVHAFAPYSRKDGKFYGKASCIGNSSFVMTGEQVELYGGAQKAPYAIEDANIKTEITLLFKEYSNWMYMLFLGATPTAIAESANGQVTALTNKFGTLVAATGLASIEAKVGSESSLKFGKYVVEAASATTVNLYASSDIDFKRGTAKTFVDDSLKINAAPLTITTGAKTDVPGFGLELTGGAGAIGMTPGDTAVFEVLPPLEEAMEVTIGGASDTFPEFGAIMLAQQRSNGEMFEIDAFRVKAAGLPHSLQEKKFAEAELKATAFYDATKNGIAKLRWVKPK